MLALRSKRAPDFDADLRSLEERSASLKMASESLREKSKVLLEPRHYFRQKLRELQTRQRERYLSMADETLPAAVREAVRSDFAAGEGEITRILVELQRQESQDR